MESNKACTTRVIACALEEPRWYHVVQGDMFVNIYVCNSVASGCNV